MDQSEQNTQAYIETPWRKQLQLIGLFSLILVFVALVAGIYLNVSARTAKVGREIQYMKHQIETMDRDIEDKQTLLALLLSDREMELRAESLGFELASVEETQWIAVPANIERNTAILAPYSNRTVVRAFSIPDEYTEPLMMWLQKQFRSVSFSLPMVNQ